ncbi:MAG: methionyl-tRNA formyltransferase, partial [Gammaproteobacteria bacterium]|nr:methionyl-tRNA formyltransferase [Gammaproteobacteria bacterium]
MNKPLRLIYAGTPDFSVPALRALHGAGHTIVAVLTQPDRPAGRGRKLQASPVKQAALALGLEVLQPLSLRKAAIKKQLRRLQADAMIVAAYGLILPQSVLDIPRLGCLNIHASLL